MGFTPPSYWSETASILKKSGQCILDSSGNGVVTFDTDSANQRWVISSIVVSTNQSSTANPVPYATGALNTTSLSQMSISNSFGTTYSGNNDSFSGDIDVSPMDFFSVLFYPPPGQNPGTLVGVKATAIVFGSKYTRRS